jgi:membrane protein YqaA with SNARE-associated domain
MTRIGEWVQSFALNLGGPGLFVVAFCDSSFLSLPEINDLLIILMVTRQKDRMLFYVTMATLGSIAGCLVLYGVARTGGEAVLRRRFDPERLERAMRLSQRYGMVAILIPSLLPPPAPFKIFVLLAGVARVPLPRFALAIGIGRGLRYFTEGMLAVRYGDAAIGYVRDNAATVAWTVALAAAAGTAGYLLWKRRSARGSL